METLGDTIGSAVNARPGIDRGKDSSTTRSGRSILSTIDKLWPREKPGDPRRPTRCAPGTPEKVEVLTRRHFLGLPLWHPEDVTFEQVFKHANGKVGSDEQSIADIQGDDAA